MSKINLLRPVHLTDNIPPYFVRDDLITHRVSITYRLTLDIPFDPFTTKSQASP